MNKKLYYGLTLSDKFMLFLIGGFVFFSLVIGGIMKPENIPVAVAAFIGFASVIGSGIITRKLALLELTDKFFGRIRNDVPEDVIVKLGSLKYLPSSEEDLTHVLEEIMGKEETTHYKGVISEHVAKLLDEKYSRPKRQMLTWIRRLLWIPFTVANIKVFLWIFCGETKGSFIDVNELFQWLFGFFL